MFILTNIRITRITLDIGILFTNSRGHLLISHINTSIPLLCFQIRWSRHELRSGILYQRRESSDFRVSDHLSEIQKSSEEIERANNPALSRWMRLYSSPADHTRINWEGRITAWLRLSFFSDWPSQTTSLYLWSLRDYQRDCPNFFGYCLPK